jgi:sigma-B regulation protein RsbU (phosphoserine phosphatase)
MPSRVGVSLGTKLIIAAVLLLAAAIGTSAIYGLRTLDSLARSYADSRRAEHESAMKRETELVVRNVVLTAGLPLAESNYTYLQNLARTTAAENRNIAWIVVADSTTNRVVARTDQAPPGEVLDDALSPKLRQAPASSEVYSQRSATDPDHIVFGASIALGDKGVGDQRVGEVRLSLDISELETAKQRALDEGRELATTSARNQLLFAGILLAIGVLLSFWQGHSITRPLQALSQKARSIAGGNFSARAAVTSRDEIGQLAESFNMMAESLGMMVAEIARKASLEREIELARTIQGLMTPPPDLFTLGSFQLVGSCEMASSCGGDWWSYRKLTDGRLLVVIGDVTGHGMAAAMIAASARGAVESLSMLEHKSITPTVVLLAIDRAIRDVGNHQLLMTCFSLILSPNGHLDFANAGHTFPYVMHRKPSGDADLTVLSVRSNPLGSAHPHVNAGEHRLAPGDLLILTSDGVADRVSGTGERFGERRLRKILARGVPRADEPILVLRDGIVGEVQRFAGEAPLDDDMTLVLVEYRGAAVEPRARGAAA